MNWLFGTFLQSIGLFVGMLLLLELGRWLGARRLEAQGEGARSGIGAVEGAVFALLGLLLAFSFSGAAARFDARRQLVGQEVNDIGTAWLRLDVLRPEDRSALRESFRTYVDERLEVYRLVSDRNQAEAAFTRAAKAQKRIWSLAVEACRRAEMPQAASVVLPALNAMFDTATTRALAAEVHPPEIVFGMLFGSALLGALFAGYGMAGPLGRSWVHVIGFCLIVSMAVHVILDLEYPRLGLIRVDATDHFMVDLRKSME
jgi:hypothetical protein